MSAEKKSKSTFANQRSGVVNTNTLMKRGGETEEAFYKRMTVRGWLGFDKTEKPGHWKPGSSEYHAGSLNDCNRCSKDKTQKPTSTGVHDKDLADKVDMIEEKSEHTIGHEEAKKIVTQGENSALQLKTNTSDVVDQTAPKSLPDSGSKNDETPKKGKLSKEKRTRKKVTKKGEKD